MRQWGDKGEERGPPVRGELEKDPSRVLLLLLFLLIQAGLLPSWLVGSVLMLMP